MKNIQYISKHKDGQTQDEEEEFINT